MIIDSTQVDKTKRCVITLDLQLDSKWKYTINKATNVRGYADSTGGSYKVVYTVGGITVCAICLLNCGGLHLAAGPCRWHSPCPRTITEQTQSQVSNAIPPGSVGGNYVVSSTSSGAASGYGGGVASIDVLLKLMPTGTQGEVVTVDSLDVQFEYST